MKRSRAALTDSVVAPPRSGRASAKREKREAAKSGDAVGAVREGSTVAALDLHVGRLIHQQRGRDGLTMVEVANRAALSVGMLSKIENGQVSPSLESLNRLASALGVPVGHFFRNFGTPAGSALHVKHGEGMEVVRRGTHKGHTYRLLGYATGPRKRFEPFLISMDDASEVFPLFEHAGAEFLFMLEGRIEYRHGDRTYVLARGDSLSFRGDIPHGPERLIKLPIRFLSIITYDAPT